MSILRTIEGNRKYITQNHFQNFVYSNVNTTFIYNKKMSMTTFWDNVYDNHVNNAKMIHLLVFRTFQADIHEYQA